jgi:hypothetical protein
MMPSMENFVVGRKSLPVHEILYLKQVSKSNYYYYDIKSTNSQDNRLINVWDYRFIELLPSSVIEKAIGELKIKYKKRLFDPLITLWAFLSQVLDTDKSCHNAVSKIIAYLTGEGVEIPSTDTSA